MTLDWANTFSKTDAIVLASLYAGTTTDKTEFIAWSLSLTRT